MDLACLEHYSPPFSAVMLILLSFHVRFQAPSATPSIKLTATAVRQTANMMHGQLLTKQQQPEEYVGDECEWLDDAASSVATVASTLGSKLLANLMCRSSA